MNDPSNGYDRIAAEFLAGRGSRAGVGTGVCTVRDWARTVRPGGAVLDIGCGPGYPIAELLALEEREYLALLGEAGFERAHIEPTRIYTRDDAAALLSGTGLDQSLADLVDGRIMSGFVRARKPLR